MKMERGPKGLPRKGVIKHLFGPNLHDITKDTLFYSLLDFPSKK